MQDFDYHDAFSRNIGWLSREEQRALRSKRIAIAGMGGVGGDHLVRMARLGCANFSISDMDVFEQANFNRQYGATMETVGRPKVEVMRDITLSVNPSKYPGGTLKPESPDPDSRFSLSSWFGPSMIYISSLFK